MCCTCQKMVSAGDAYIIEIGGLLHDIGKIGVPDAILLKPGPLTDEEWKLMESTIGLESKSSGLPSIVPC